MVGCLQVFREKLQDHLLPMVVFCVCLWVPFADVQQTAQSVYSAVVRVDTINKQRTGKQTNKQTKQQVIKQMK